MEEKRNLKLREPIKKEEMREFIYREDTDNLDNFLVINGGTGLHKTNATMTMIKEILEEKHKRSFNIILVESRTATVDQINERYRPQIENIGGIDVKQRIAFVNIIKNKEVEKYDWVVIDECHGLFSEASFAEDASYIANWIRCGRTKQHIIFITANDEYFLEASSYYYGEGEFSQLFKNLRYYFSPTYVEYAHYIITNRTKSRLTTLLKSLRGKKGLVFLQHATSAFEWYVNFLEQGIESAFIVSLGNTTTTALSKAQETLFQKHNIDCSGGTANWTLSQIEQLIDANRIMRNKIPVRQSLIQQATIPEDIEVIFATDTLQEGLSIISHLDYIIIEGVTEVEVRQKLGRYRNNLKDLYVIFNPAQVTQDFLLEESKFQLFYQLQAEGKDNELAEAYGRMTANKWETKYILRIKQGDSYIYRVNDAAYQGFLTRKNRYIQESPQEYMKFILNPYVQTPATDIKFLQAKDFKNLEIQDSLNSIVLKYAGAPLKGKILTNLFDDLESYDITDSKNNKIDTIRKVTNLLKANNIPTKKTRVSQKIMLKYPEAELKSGEYYTYITN